MTFFDSIHCSSRVHCRACRATDRPAFRESVAEAYSLPVVGFECPHGVLWDYTPESVAAPSLPTRNAHAARLGDTLAALLRRCGFRKRSGCGCSARQAWLNQNETTVYLIVGISCFVAFVGFVSAWAAA